jgi:hypothetical protein
MLQQRIRFAPCNSSHCFGSNSFVRLFVSCFVGLACVFAQAPLVIAMNNGLPQGVRIVESSQTRLILEYTPELLGFDTIPASGKMTLQPRIKGAVVTGKEAGAPVYLHVQMPVSVPSDKGFRIVEQSARGVQSIPALMSPRREMIRLLAKRNESPYSINAALYAAPVQSWSEIRYGGIGRDKHIATLTLRAARFNAGLETIEIPKSIRIVIEFDAVPSSAQSRISPRVQEFLQTINDAASAQWRVARTSQEREIQETIATPPNTPVAPVAPQKNTTEIRSAAGRWLRIGVEREGMYRVTAQQLREAGLTITASEVASIRLFGNGGNELPQRVSDADSNRMNEQAIFTETDGSGNLTAIVFYGAAPNGFIFKEGRIQHFVNTFSRRNFYLLNVGANVQGRRATLANSPGEPTLEPTYYTARIFRDDDKFNPFDASGDGSGRRWFGDRLSSGTTTRYEHPLPNLVTNAGPVMYTISAGWNNPAGAGRGGQIFFKESGRDLLPTPLSVEGASYDYDVGEIRTVSATFPATSIRNNRTSLELLYVSSSANGDSYGAVDWYEIMYPRSFVAVDNQIDFFAEPFQGRFGIAEYNITGFTSGEQVYIVDATNRANPRFLRNINTTRLNATFRADVVSIGDPLRFFLSTQTLSVASLEMTENADLRGTLANAECIVITDKDLKTSADAYRTYRESTGIKTTVVTTEQIYTEFNGGTPDPTAIRDFIRYAFRSWRQTPPRYVLFWGDGHFDYRGLDPVNKPKNFVPTYQIYDADGFMNSVNTNYMTEDYFVQVNGADPLVDLALGRLCVRSNAEGTTILSKIRQYESTSSTDNWRSQITLLADDGPTTSISNSDRSLHTNQSETLSNSLIPADIRQRKLYMADYPTENVPGGRRRPSVTQELVAAVNEGTVILNWIGHGNPRLWAHENIFIKDIHIPQFTNIDRLFFLVAATCDFARFDNLREQSGAEDMISSTRGGAIGTFAAARTVYSLDNAAISQALYEQLFINTNGLSAPRIGDAFYRVKQLFYSGSFENDLKFCLLGDPTVRLALPEQRIVIESLNGASMQNVTTPQQIKALSNVSITGYVAAPTTTRADVSFTGNVLCNLYDTDIQKAATDVDADRTIHNFTTLGGLLSIGSAVVQNGRFSLNFTVPKDISFSNQNGRMFLYAVSGDNRKFGRGMTAQFTLGGVNESAVNDGNGPEIRIFMDSRTFRAGDLVDSTPRLIADLYDATGINATGVGIGHDIQCWIDDNPIPINLTSSFRVSLSDPRRGEVNRVLSRLAPGQHRIRVRAWDVFNNFSEAETFFRVASSNNLVLTDVVNFPNSFTASTTIRFRHNQLTPQPYTVIIANIAGVTVRQFSGMTTARTMEIPWDGRTENGVNVAGGTYLYRIDLTGANGETQAASGIMMKVP